MEKAIDEVMAAKILSLSVQTLRNWRCQRKGPPYLKLGRAVRYNLKDIERYRRKKTINPEGLK